MSVLRTKDLAEAIGVSVQQVRNYEVQGFLPPVPRTANGYRRYTPQHVAALTLVKALTEGYGWQRTQAIMRALHAGAVGEALAHINECHAELDATRLQLERTLAALGGLTEQLPAGPHPRAPMRLRVGDAARATGVRVSAIRFWEQQGLLHPTREAGSRYRLYDERQLRRLRIVALLRQGHHDFTVIHATLDELEAGQPQRAIAAVEQRRVALVERSWHCVQALAQFHAYVTEFIGAPAVSTPSRRAPWGV